MGYFLVYILKSSLSLAAFYLFYKVTLSRETFHRFNRVVLISSLLLSVLIPLFKIPGNEPILNNTISLNIEQLIELAGFGQDTLIVSDNIDSPLSVWPVLIVVLYLTGAFVTLIISAVSIIRMSQIIHRTEGCSRIKTDNGTVIILHKEKIAPFSWMRYIVISEKDYEENGKEIVVHEVAHIKGRHSADLILCEIVKIVHWFNPAAWLLKQELKNIHEYQADDAVIKNGIDACSYQLLLIKKAVGDRLYSIANSFNHSKLKNRITMITKKKSTLWAALKVLYVLPLSLIAVVAFASEEITSAMAPVSEIKIKDFIQTDTTKTKKVSSKVEVKTAEKRTIVVRKSGPEQSQIDTIIIRRSIDDSTKALVKGRISTFVYNSDSLSNNKITTLSYRNGDSVNVMVYVDGVERDTMYIKQIDSREIKEIRVYKGEKAVAEFGDKAKEGVIVISTKGKISDPENKEVSNVIVKVADKTAKPLYVIDGVVQDSDAYKQIDPKSISSIKVLKGEAATKEYGEKAKNGVILINLKK